MTRRDSPPKPNRRGAYVAAGVGVAALAAVVGFKFLRAPISSAPGKQPEPVRAADAREALDATEVTSDDRRYLVEAEVVARIAGVRLESDARTVTWEKDGDPEGTIFIRYLSRPRKREPRPIVECKITRWATVEEAKEAWEAFFEQSFGDEAKELRLEGAWAATLLENGEPAGNLVYCRSGRSTFLFGCYVVHLEEQQLEKLLRPYLDEFETWMKR